MQECVGGGEVHRMPAYEVTELEIVEDIAWGVWRSTAGVMFVEGNGGDVVCMFPNMLFVPAAE